VEILQQFLETQLRNGGTSDTVVLQQDMATAHSMNAVQEKLNHSLHERWRCTASSRLWAICSPDLICVHCFAWCVILWITKQNLMAFMN
jgi:hypothetical protein